MKTIIIVGLVVLLGTGTVYGAAKLIKGEEFATVGLGSESVMVYKVVDGATTCYVTKGGKTVYHAISCVK